MVKLLFNPKKTDLEGINSKSSKKQEPNFNPFKNIDYPCDIESNEPEFLKCSNNIGLENTHFIVNSWYKESLENKSTKNLLLIGPTGCGKTTLINSFCKEEDILLYSVKNDLSKKDLIKEILNFSEYISSEGTNFFLRKPSKKLILIDEYQSDILSISDINNMYIARSNFNNLKPVLKEINTTFTESINVLIPPIIVISADSKGSKLSELKKLSTVYYIGEINKGSIKTWIKKEYPNIRNVDSIIDKCGSDKRLLINTLEYLKSDEQGLDNYIQLFYKDSETNIFEFVDSLFDNIEQIPINEIFKIYESDGYHISNLVHENYLDYSNDIHSIAKSADAISYGETLFNDMYDSMTQFNPQLHCLHAVYSPSIYSRSDIKKNKCQIRSSVINNRHNIFLNNKKNINKINEFALTRNNVSINEILYIKQFVTYELVKTKILKDSHLEYLKNILGTFQKESAIHGLELIYKHFSEFKDSLKEPKTKNFTIKFKDKLNTLLK